MLGVVVHKGSSITIIDMIHVCYHTFACTGNWPVILSTPVFMVQYRLGAQELLSWSLSPCTCCHSLAK